ncbi:Uncharacterized protein FKW44_007694 [Caligus rogercresseyi]|uniref:Uncharacterized protein n=1 Tax=Caligus rogercresseyi TaxID=217165 RepID=A0A7T8KFF5_CALRO|nr:Uncharacterized protein FKW44_007694 [Caligus rogercresseyi]
MYWTCLSFFKSVPGEEDLCKWFEAKMANPLELLAQQPLLKSGECLVHDWQMIHWGPATDDLCFLLFSSSTASWRRRHWLSAISTYYEAFSGAVKASGTPLEYVNLTYDNFMDDIRASMPLSIFFCGNVRDLQLDEDFPVISDDESEFICMKADTTSSCGEGQPSLPLNESNNNEEEEREGLFLLERRGLKKIPTIASHRELCKMEKMKEEGQKIGDIPPKEARAMRRKLYLDLYREALSNHNI